MCACARLFRDAERKVSYLGCKCLVRRSTFPNSKQPSACCECDHQPGSARAMVSKTTLASNHSWPVVHASLLALRATP
eukprot:14992593-Alexandrium_andersonii.AAC.1